VTGPDDAADPGSGAAFEREDDRDRLIERIRELEAANLRLAADHDNFRKRKVQELADCRRYGGAPLLAAVLPALDNLSRAVAHLPEGEEDQLATGLRLTVRQLEEGLASEGIRTVPAVGAPFDPVLHEAVATEPGGAIDHDTVTAELRPGYRYHDRVVRPAQVRVARAGEPLPAGDARPVGGAGAD